MSGSTSPLNPTYMGIVHNTREALVLFEACLSGRLNHVPRRPHDRERNHLIRSGHIFIYEEHASGIKRWTDGINWSPSRILGNFLVYRELDGKVHPGEKKRALKNKSPTKRPNSGGITKSTSRNSTSFNTEHWGPPSPEALETSEEPGQGDDRDPLRQLVGSLTDSYDFKQPEGLVKKTISVKINGVTHHLVNYYSVEHAIAGVLKRPWNDPAFFGINIRPELYHQQTFRAPIGPDCYDEAGNGYIANVVGAAGPFDRMNSMPGQLPLPVQRQYPDNTHFDAFGQAAPSQLGNLSGQLPGQFTPAPMGGQFPGQLGGGYQMPMTLPPSFPSHAPANYQQQHSSFDSNFDGHFGASPVHGNSFKVEPNNFKVEPNQNDPNDGQANYGGNNYGGSHDSLPNGEPEYSMDGQFPDYNGQ